MCFPITYYLYVSTCTKHDKPCYLFSHILPKPFFFPLLSPVPACSMYSLYFGQLQSSSCGESCHYVCAGAARQRRAINILQIVFRVGLRVGLAIHVHWSGNWRQSFMNYICFPGLLPHCSENAKQHAHLKIEVEQ